jgi:hypothetical protein
VNRTIRAYLVLSRFAVTAFFLYKLKVCDNSASSKSIGATFPTVCNHIPSMSHFGNSRNISNFSLLSCLLWGSVIFDVTVVIVLWRNRIACYRETSRERNRQSIRQTSMLSYFKKFPQPSQPSDTTTLVNQQSPISKQDPLPQQKDYDLLKAQMVGIF